MKVLITGASGFLGKRIVRHYQNKYECITPSHNELEISDEDSCMRYMKQISPEFVIHTAAISDTGICEKNPDMTYKTNVVGAENLAKACVAVNSRLIFTSSDQVYNGVQGIVPNREDDICNPVNVYGRQKLEAEQRIMKILPESVILRLTWLYDLPTSQMGTKDNFLTGILDAINNNQKISFSDKEYRGITYVNEVVHNIQYLFDVPGGIYNFGSYTETTTYMLARQVFEILGEHKKMDTLIEKQENLMPRNLVMNQERLNQQQIYFLENRDGILKCLKEKGEI